MYRYTSDTRVPDASVFISLPAKQINVYRRGRRSTRVFDVPLSFTATSNAKFIPYSVGMVIDHPQNDGRFIDRKHKIGKKRFHGSLWERELSAKQAEELY